jgi:hypothetical protein
MPIDDEIKTLNESKLMNKFNMTTEEPAVFEGLQRGYLCYIRGKMHPNAANFTLQLYCVHCSGLLFAFFTIIFEIGI